MTSNQEWRNTPGCPQLGLIGQVCACFPVLHELLATITQIPKTKKKGKKECRLLYITVKSKVFSHVINRSCIHSTVFLIQ